MFPKDSRREGRNDRPRRRPGRVAVEGLETRQLMAYSPFGYSLPQLTVSGFAASEAAWGGQLAVDVTVLNQGASSLIEPTHLSPTTVDPSSGDITFNHSTADAAPTTVEVYASTRPNAKFGAVKLGTISIPAVTQNSEYETVSTITLPARPKGFPSNGGKIYLTLVADNSQTITQADATGDVYRVPNPVRIANPLPNLQVLTVDEPTTLQPGDVISPTIRIENFGAGNPATQGVTTVQVVASLDKNFGPGDAVVATYTISSLPGISNVPTQNPLFLGTNLVPAVNINTTTLSPFKLPTSPGFYYLGIEIDPTASIKMTTPPKPALMGVVQVGPRDPYLTPTTLITSPSGVIPVFPYLPSTVIAPVAPTTPTITPTNPRLVIAFSTPGVSASSLRARKKR